MDRIRALTRAGVVMLPLFALVLIAIGYLQPRAYAQSDEGALAHLFQLSIAMLLPVGLLFLGTADWRQPGRNVRAIIAGAAFLAVAFVALYYGEHYYR